MSHFTSADLPIILASITVAGTLGGTLAGTWFGSSREQEHWLRTERARAYAAFYAAIQRANHDEHVSQYTVLNEAAGPVIILGPSDVSELVRPVVQAFLVSEDREANLEAKIAAERAFLVAASRAIGAVRPSENWMSEPPIQT